MPDRLTADGRAALASAEWEARRFDHEYIGTEHILLGLVKEGSWVAANVLKNLDVDLRKIRLEVEKIVQTGPGGDQVVLGKLPHTPRAKKVIEYSVEEARNLNHNYVGTEHLLLGLLREQEGVAAQVLMNLGLKPGDVREELGRFMTDLARWRTGDVLGLARGIAADRAFARLPILADALMDAGCDDAEVLGHLRRGAAHGCGRPGCWVLDRLLGSIAPAVADGTGSTRKWWKVWV